MEGVERHWDKCGVGWGGGVRDRRKTFSCMLLGNGVVTVADDVTDPPLHGFCLALYPLCSISLDFHCFSSFNFSLAATLQPRIHDFFIVLRGSQLCLLPLSPSSLLLTYLSSSFHHVSAPSDSTLPKGGESVGWLWTCVVEAHLSPAAPPTLHATHYSHSLCFLLNSSALTVQRYMMSHQYSLLWSHSFIKKGEFDQVNIYIPVLMRNGC